MKTFRQLAAFLLFGIAHLLALPGRLLERAAYAVCGCSFCRRQASR